MYATGFNAFYQLDQRSDISFPNATEAGEDIYNFQRLSLPGPVTLFHATWSTTTLLSDTQLLSQGHQRFAIDIDASLGLHSPFGDLDGLIGCLDAKGHVHYLICTDGEQGTWSLKREPGDEERPLLSNVVLAGNGRVAITFKQAPNAKLTHVTEFASLADFRRWHAEPSSSDNYPPAHHMVAGRPAQLIANAAIFIMLMEGGEVYTWGDPRFRTLARPTTGEHSLPASQPGAVEALSGLNIVKVACGIGRGWLGAALSEDGAAYVWGAGMPSGEGEIKCLKEAEAGEVVLVELPDSDAGAEPEDVIDVSVGTNHLAGVTASGRLFVVGENKNGQLGLDAKQDFWPDWTEVRSLSNVKHVLCAPKATLACNE